MKAVHVVSGTGLPLKRSDVDTDQIIPAEWLKRVERTGFEQGLFATWRDDRNFVLNDERYVGASIIVAGRRSASGRHASTPCRRSSSTGFDAVVAPSFSDIFRNNCTKNGLVAVVVPESVVERIWAAIDDDPATEITVDVERLVVEVPAIGLTEPFPMDGSPPGPVAPRSRRCRHHTEPRRAITTYEQYAPAGWRTRLDESGPVGSGAGTSSPVPVAAVVVDHGQRQQQVKLPDAALPPRQRPRTSPTTLPRRARPCR